GLNICPEGIPVDAIKLKNLPNLSLISSVLVNIAGEPQKPVQNTDISMSRSPNYSSEITSLVTGMHNELKAINIITPQQLKEIEDFDPARREMFLTCIRGLESLKAGEINAAGYMMNIME